MNLLKHPAVLIILVMFLVMFGLNIVGVMTAILFKVAFWVIIGGAIVWAGTSLLKSAGLMKK
jgi:hypothetical protein